MPMRTTARRAPLAAALLAPAALRARHATGRAVRFTARPGGVSGRGLRQLAADGDPGVLADWVRRDLQRVGDSGVVTRPPGDAKPGPITPGTYEFPLPAAAATR
jgi:hypothetical protein